MKIELSLRSKQMAGVLALALVVVLCSGESDCFEHGCNDETKQDIFPGNWVSCVNNQPALMSYTRDKPDVVTKAQAGFFNPKDYDCSHSGSPDYKGSEASPPFQLLPPAGPQATARLLSDPRATRPRDASSSSVGYTPPVLRDLPFVPQAPAPAAQCDPSAPDVFQTVHTNAQVTRFSTCPFQIKARIPVVTRPLQIQITPDGSTALVTSFDHAVNFIDLASNRVTFTLTTPPSVTPNGLAIAPDGSKAYITGYSMNNSSVQVIDLKTRTITASFPTTIPWAQSATLTPDGSQLWVNTDNLDAGIDIFDTLTNTLVTTLNITFPTDIAFNSTGTVAYITSSGTTPGSVYAINTATFQTIQTYTVGNNPADIAMSYGDQFLVVNNSDGTVNVIDLQQKKISSVKIGTSPVSGIAFVK